MNTNLSNESHAAAATLKLRDVAIVSTAIALVIFGNIALVQAMDRALDAFVR